MKKRRQKELLNIIRNNRVATQDELMKYLLDAGYETTQATISRDMKELGIDKVDSFYAVVPRSTSNNMKYVKILSECVKTVDNAMNIVVVKTLVGMGAAAGAAIDAFDWEEVVGSIAGDDTVFLVTRTQESAELLKKTLEEYIQTR
ncbi:MAG: hypothetical protein J6L23_05895 [Clostridia bacterium]|nr:hypothetical protein [Clostridia bacterium]